MLCTLNIHNCLPLYGFCDYLRNRQAEVYLCNGDVQSERWKSNSVFICDLWRGFWESNCVCKCDVKREYWESNNLINGVVHGEQWEINSVCNGDVQMEYWEINMI